MTHVFLPRAEGIASRPRQLGAAGCLMHTSDGPDMRVLLLHSPHKGWQLPGGALDADEDPWQGAVRETFEETGWTVTVPPHLLALNWYPTEGEPPEAHYIFDGGLVPADYTPRLSDEHDNFALVTPEQWTERLGTDQDYQLRRLPALRRSVIDGRTAYLTQGYTGGSSQ